MEKLKERGESVYPNFKVGFKQASTFNKCIEIFHVPFTGLELGC